MDNEKSQRMLTAHFVEIQSEQEIQVSRIAGGVELVQSGTGHAVTVVLQSHITGSYIASGVGTSSSLAEAQRTARAQFIKNLKERWGLE